MPARLTVLSGPSGVGKGSVVAEVRRSRPQLWVSVSATTRARRPGEEHGREYLFVDQSEFDRMAAAGELLEHDAHLGASYGTPRGPVEQRLADGVPVLLEIDLEGARQVRRATPEAHLVFLAPPDPTELARRLRDRGTESDDRVRERLARAELEMAAATEFDEVIVNGTIEDAAARLVSSMGLAASRAGHHR